MTKSILWFRQDLRLHDNPALLEAAKSGKVIPVYILDSDSENPWPLGGASKWWLHHSLKSLQESGVPLVIRRGKPLEVLKDLLSETGATRLFWNRCYEPHSIERDKIIKDKLGCATSCNGSLLFEPWTIKTKTDSFFKVFTPFWKACLASPPPRPTCTTTDVGYSRELPPGLDLNELGLLPTNPNWAKGFHEYWQPGEEGAKKKLADFLQRKVANYARGRDYPAQNMTSLLSPHLHWGEISPHQIWDTITSLCDPSDINTQRFLAELGWREFSYNLLYHHPQLPTIPFQSKFASLPWEDNEELLERWQKGLTGFPLIDAGMRELWATGYMHNRVRMVVASFLTKHCLIPWQKGEEWFWDTLVDADLANNAASWQWVAGCGADAAPFFRIFNPVTQSEKFDPQGDYIRKWIPELKEIHDKKVHTPWKLEKAERKLIGRYPEPLIDLSIARTRALQAYEIIKL